MKSPHERLRHARKQAGFRSATAFARAKDLHEVTYRSHENGIRGLNVETAQRYAQKLGVSAAWLLTGEGAQQGVEKGETKAVTIEGAIDSSMGGCVRAAEEPYTLTFRPPAAFKKASFFGLVMEENFHAEFPEGSELIFAHADSLGHLEPGKLVVVEETRNGKIQRHFGRLGISGEGIVIRFAGRDTRHHNSLVFCPESGEQAGGLHDSARAGSLAARTQERTPPIPLEHGAMRIVGVLVKSSKNE